MTERALYGVLGVCNSVDIPKVTDTNAIFRCVVDFGNVNI